MHRPTKSPATTGMVNGAKSKLTKRIFAHAGAVLRVIFLNPGPGPALLVSMVLWLIWLGVLA